MKHKVVQLDQTDYFASTFNILIPREIQGQECVLISEGQPATRERGTTSSYILVNGKRYGVPRWAVEKVKDPSPQDFSI